MNRTAPLTSKRCILYIYSTNTGTEYFKHALHSPFFSLQNAVCFIMLTSLVPVLFTFHIQGVLKLKKNTSGAKGLTKLASLTNTIYKQFQLQISRQDLPCTKRKQLYFIIITAMPLYHLYIFHYQSSSNT